MAPQPTPSDSQNNRRTLLAPLATFAVLAFAITYLIHLLPPLVVFTSGTHKIELISVLCGFGPLLAGALCYRLFKTPTVFSLGGRAPQKAWLAVGAVFLVSVFTSTRFGLAYAALSTMTQLLYCLGEEYGWRHYLQSAVAPLGRWAGSAIIGCLWYVWHYSWLSNPVGAMMGSQLPLPPWAATLLFLGLLILCSDGLGRLMNRTHSVILPILLHFALKSTPLALLTAGLATAWIVFTTPRTSSAISVAAD